MVPGGSLLAQAPAYTACVAQSTLAPWPFAEKPSFSLPSGAEVVVGGGCTSAPHGRFGRVAGVALATLPCASLGQQLLE